MPELKASPRNRALGLLADALSGAKSAADTVQLPVVGGLGSLLFGDAPELVNDVAYYGPQALVRGGNAATGGLGTFAPDRRVLDAIGVAPMAPGAVRAAKTVANPMTYGRAFAEAQAPAVMSPITAWHGSPHKFRKFDNSKVGTGAGQAWYGHGQYLSDSKDLAESYHDMLMKLHLKDKTGKIVNTLDETTPEGKAQARFANAMSAGVDDPVNFSKNQLLGIFRDSVEDKEKAVAELGRLAKISPTLEREAYLYKTDVPDSEVGKMLLWDEPVSAQPENVKKIISGGFDSNSTGADIYSLLANSSNPKEASEYLKSLGIPGIRHKDEWSDGIMNTVVFDDSIIKILERNGVPLGLLAD